ncbi:MAG TPA: class I SAM-dependent methyltransferase [Candidatus Acidoferrales bacterium]|nr:class I SAM-dependent methyltransferase [Candidatus Acidoferrales bacterium]
MMLQNEATADRAVASRVAEFYRRHPYPPPVDDLEAYRRTWNDARRRAEAHLFWPSAPYREDRRILVAGCGTVQAAHYAVRWPNASVLGVDVSAESVAFTRELKERHALDNLEAVVRSLEDAGELGGTFDWIVCTGVLHHLPDPDAGLRALRAVLAPGGAMHVMVYAPYGRAGIYMLQEYCRRLGIGASDAEIDELAAALRTLPEDHPIVPLLRESPDFGDVAGMADALLNPQDRAYTAGQLADLLARNGLRFGRWIRQAPYLASCGSPANGPHRPRLAAMDPMDCAAALELFRGTMVRHSVVAYRDDEAALGKVDFDGDAADRFVPVRIPGTIAVREKLPPGAAAVLLNRNHTYRDLYLPIDAEQARLFDGIDGVRTIGELGRQRSAGAQVQEFFRRLWEWDQIVVDTSGA